MRELVCIVCPKGCRLAVDEENEYAVTGNDCPRGEAYGKEEVRSPTRVLTSTVAVTGGVYRRCPVKTERPIPKEAVFEAVRALDDVCLQAPVAAGQAVLKNVCGTGVDIVTTREM